jgi:hypothetical protein
MNSTIENRVYPNWYTRARVRKADAQGTVTDGHAFNGELVAVSPRFQRNGMNYRVRPERPAAFFAAFCYENGLLPELLTPEEAASDWGLKLLEPLWLRHKNVFMLLGSPFAACDDTVPDLRVGFSFNIRQKVIEVVGSIKPSAARSTFRPAVVGQPNGAIDLEAARATIAAMRAQASNAQPAPTVNPAVDEQLAEDDEELKRMREELAAQATTIDPTMPETTPEPEPVPAPAATTNGRGKRHR